ncbi:MAG: translation initiation factor IF-2 [Sedimentisphaerales bacterium]|nr:translation initiation factor IF-2 [Sedimentisphaerales bacterium]
MATTRVHLLAKELGVKSKSILDKCQAEGLDVKNHMSTISAGLAATIREWFSEGEHITAVETTARVDLKKARIKKKTPKNAAAPKKTDKKEKSKVSADDKAEVKAAVVEPPVEETAEKPKTEQVEQPIQTEPARPRVELKPELPKPPKSVAPAGPKLKKPKPAKLSGPRVIRVEEPEQIERPRPKTKSSKPSYLKEASEPLLASAPETMNLRPHGGKSKSKTHGRKHEDYAEEEPNRHKKVGRKLRSRDIEERRARLSAASGEGMRLRPVRKIETKRSKAEETTKIKPEKAYISEPIIVKDLSAALAVKTTEIIEKLIEHSVMANANQTIPTDVAELVALELGTELIVQHKKSIEEQIAEEFENRSRNNMQKRPAIVTMLGHVDHGKTSLLDKIRSTTVVKGEAGGITQHIGASQVIFGDKDNQKKVTFLDTPGHEAFTAMRARGANMTDIVVLVVAADDGVMPQTIEAIHHAKAAGVHIIIALNKIDLPGVDLNRIYGQFAEHELTPVEWSGNTDIVKTSATTGEGVEELLEHLDYAAELLELQADPTLPATGWVIEARISPKKGPVATILIKEGILKKGDVILAGTGYGRIRALRDSLGKSIRSADSAMPVEISGLNDVPQAGDKFYCLADLNRAKAAADEKKTTTRKAALGIRSQITMENLFSQIEAGKAKEVNIIIRADVQGSVDVLTKYLTEISTDEVQVKILHAAVGGITEGDALLAEASGAIIIGFNVVPEDKAVKLAEEKGIDIRLYNIIYRIAEDLRKAMVGMLEPEEQINSIGRAVVRDTFKVSGVGTIAGCYVEQGEVNRNSRIRLIRDNIIVKDNCQIESLKHFKDDVRQVKNGFECGIKIAGFDDVKTQDVFEVYEIVKVERTL